jgi:DNA-binding Lrp family transcriptional regulator
MLAPAKRLEQDGYIKGYRADLDREKLGVGIVNLITVTLATHNRDNAQRFARLIGGTARSAGSLFADRRDGLHHQGGNAGSAQPVGLCQRYSAAA